MKKLYVFATTLLFFTSTFARSDSVLSPSLTYGQARFFGKLNKPSRTQQTLGFTLSSANLRAYDGDSLGGRFGTINLEIDSVDANNDYTSFPFKPDASLSIFSVAIMPNYCFLGESPIQACLGFGLNLLQVADSDNLQSYGTFRYSLSLGRLRVIDSGFLAYLRLNGVLPVQQIVNSENSSFSYLSLVVGLGWQFNFR